MSWEDCGFNPGKIDGPEKCPRGSCSDCDGFHHFYAHDNSDDGSDWVFACKHCDTTAEMVDDDEAFDE